jgi:hypothetical protein
MSQLPRTRLRSLTNIGLARHVHVGIQQPARGQRAKVRRVDRAAVPAQLTVPGHPARSSARSATPPPMPAPFALARCPGLVIYVYVIADRACRCRSRATSRSRTSSAGPTSRSARTLRSAATRCWSTARSASAGPPGSPKTRRSTVLQHRGPRPAAERGGPRAAVPPPAPSWPRALRAVRAWLSPWIALQRWWTAWSKAPPPPQLQALINSVAAGCGLHLYILN